MNHSLRLTSICPGRVWHVSIQCALSVCLCHMEPMKRSRKGGNCMCSTALAGRMIRHHTSRRAEPRQKHWRGVFFFQAQMSNLEGHCVAFVCYYTFQCSTLTNLWEKYNCACRELVFFLKKCFLLLLFSVGFVSPSEMGPRARSHKTQMHAPFFFFS